MFLIFALFLLMLLVSLTKINFNEDRFVEALLFGGIAFILISPKDMYHGKLDESNSPKANFSYINFRGYFTFILGIGSIFLYAWLKVYILK
jgi:hypothetical protein